MCEIDLLNINLSLDEKSWFYQDQFISDELCLALSNICIENIKKELLIEAKIGKKKTKDLSIRNSSIQWIDDWEESTSLRQLNSLFTEIMDSVNNYFRLSMKRFESQFTVYNPGGFYKCHLDQHKKTRHRQVSCSIYLNDCAAGGVLVIYKKGSKTEIDKVIRPVSGSIVLFFSRNIYHEVKIVQSPRYSLTTWFRDDEIY